MILTTILKIALATLKMENFEMANEKIFFRKDQRTYSESLILVSGSAGLSQNPDVSISTTSAYATNTFHLLCIICKFLCTFLIFSCTFLIVDE